MKKIQDIFKKAGDNKVIVFLDTETTGVGEGDRIIQNAHSVFIINNGKLDFQHYVEEYVEAPLPITPGAAAVHGIWEEDLIGAKPWEKTQSSKELKALQAGGAIFCAHNSPFDLGMLEKEGIVWSPLLVIDTLRVARHIYKDDEKIESKGMQWLRYFFNFDKNQDFKELVESFGVKRLQAHTALSDIVVLIYLFKEMLRTCNDLSIEKMLELSITPIIEDKVTFGNVFEKGSKLSEAITGSYIQYDKPKTGLSYYSWAMKNMETLSMDQKYCISYFAMKGCMDKKLSLSSADIKPMIFFAATFIPEFWPFLRENGFNQEDLSEKVLRSIEQKIVLQMSEESTKNSAIKLQGELTFMLNYLNGIL